MDRKATISPRGWVPTRPKLVLGVRSAFLHILRACASRDPWLAVASVAMCVAVVGLSLELAWMFESRAASALCCLGLGLLVGVILARR